MALNEVSFYNVNGDEISISNLVNQMVNYYKLKHEVGDTVITDFNEGSEIRNILEAFAVLEYARLEEESNMASLPFIQTSEGVWLDKIGEMPFIDCPRIEGSEAEGIVQFSLSEAQETDIVIPAETIVSDSENEIDFLTLEDCVIFAGDTSRYANVEAVTMGVDGNVKSGSIDFIDDEEIDTNLVSVTNLDDFTGGSDFETDDDYRTRLLENVQKDGFGSLPYYINLCENVSGVHDVKFIPDTNYTNKVLVNGYSKPTPDNVLLDTLTELTNLDKRVLNHNFIVGIPDYTTINLEFTFNVVSEIDEEDLQDFIRLYINGGRNFSIDFEGLRIDEVLYRDKLVSVFNFFENIIEVTSITSNNVEITEIAPNVNSVLKLGDVSITQIVV